MQFSHASSARLLLAIGLLWLSSAAEAQIRYVASTGRDTNPCTKAAPCLTLQHGIDATAASGELRVLDSGSYGAATIAKSLTVASDGATVFGKIKINAAGATVVLRGLTLNGTGSADLGIEVSAALAVHIEHCTVERFSEHGIYAASNSKIFVIDTVARDNGWSGLIFFPGSSEAELIIDHSHFDSNRGGGVGVLGGRATVTRTIAAGNGVDGFQVHQASATFAWTTAANNKGGVGYLAVQATIEIENSVSNSNFAGLIVASSTATISGSLFTGNTRGIYNAGGTIRTRGNNTVVGNGTDIDGMLTPLAAK